MNIKLIRTTLFRDRNGNDLRLDLGKIEDMEASNRFMGFVNNDDRGFRWRFVGRNIPMPIRSYEWFNGFPDYIMEPWIKSQGYEMVASTNHVTGSVYVVKGNEIPCVSEEFVVTEAPKGNEPYKLTEQAIHNGNRALAEAIKLLCSNGGVLLAISLYRLVHPCCLKDAKEAVDAIRFPK